MTDLHIGAAISVVGTVLLYLITGSVCVAVIMIFALIIGIPILIGGESAEIPNYSREEMEKRGRRLW